MNVPSDEWVRTRTEHGHLREEHGDHPNHSEHWAGYFVCDELSWFFRTYGKTNLTLIFCSSRNQWRKRFIDNGRSRKYGFMTCTRPENKSQQILIISAHATFMKCSHAIMPYLSGGNFSVGFLVYAAVTCCVTMCFRLNNIRQCFCVRSRKSVVPQKIWLVKR